MRWSFQSNSCGGLLVACLALAGCAGFAPAPSAETTVQDAAVSAPSAASVSSSTLTAAPAVVAAPAPTPPSSPASSTPDTSSATAETATPAAAAAPTEGGATTTSPAEGDGAVSQSFKKQGDKLAQEGGSLVDVAVQPIHDLNLIEQVIPPVLIAAKKQGPYALPAKTDCDSMLAEIKALDAALGPDIDAPARPSSDPSLAEKAVDRALDYLVQPAVNSVRATVNYFFDGVLPFRSWVRKLSGAERASAEVASAIGAGALRRPFIKGWFRGAGCVMPPPSVIRVAPPPPVSNFAPLAEPVLRPYEPPSRWVDMSIP